MNQEKESRRINNSSDEYFAPSITLVEFKAGRMIFQQSSNAPFTGDEVDDIG